MKILDFATSISSLQIYGIAIFLAVVTFKITSK